MNRSLETTLAAPLLAAVTLISYLTWLGWDQHKDVAPDGTESGPYQWWQVAGLGLVLVSAAAAAGWRRHVWAPIIAIPLVLTVCWSVDAATDQDGGLWPIGAVLLAVGSTVGIGFVASLAAAGRIKFDRRHA